MQNDIILPKEKTKKQKNGTDTISPPNKKSQNPKSKPMNPAHSSLTHEPNPCLPNPYEPRPPHQLYNQVLAS